MSVAGPTGPAPTECNSAAAITATLPERPRTQTELEIEGGRKALERRLRAIYGPNKTKDAAPVCPSPPSSLVAAVTAKPAQAEGIKREIQPSEQPGPNAVQDSAIVFHHATALESYKAVRLSAFILGYTLGKRITSIEEFQALAKKAENEHKHLFFHVATVKPTWTTATKDQILECNFLWGDCDADKYVGNDPTEAAKHYSDEGFRISRIIDEALNRLGIQPFAKWRSGAGWQFLIKLDQPISPDEAEVLVGKLHVALGFDPVVRNCNRILRVPGSINWKDGKDGRVPSQCLPMCLRDTVTRIDDVRNALASVTMPATGAKASGATENKIDWSKVNQPGWLNSVADLPGDVPDKLRVIIGHTGTLYDLNRDLIETGNLTKPYHSWSDVTLAIAAGLKFYAKYTLEEIAEALLADLPCNQHVARQKNKERAIERAISRSHGPNLVGTSDVRFRDWYKGGMPKPSLANAVIAIRALGIDVRQDLFHHRINVTYNGARRIAQPPIADLCHEAPTHPVARTSRSSATGSIDNSPGGFFLH